MYKKVKGLHVEMISHDSRVWEVGDWIYSLASTLANPEVWKTFS